MPLAARPQRLIRALVAALVGVATLTGPAAQAQQAEERPQFSLRPAGQAEATFFDLQAAPGEARLLEVEISNLGTQPVRARTYAADAYTIVNGGFGMRLFGEPPSGATTWLDYPAEVLEMAPGQTVTRPFRLRVPADVRPGEHLTGLAVENADAIEGSGSVALNQVVRKAIAVLVTVPGPVRPGLEIGAAEHLVVADRSVVAVTLRNPGNVRLRPQGDIVVSDATGQEVARSAVTMDSFYAGTDARLEVPLDRRLPPGDYAIGVNLRDSAREVSASTPALPLTVSVEKEPDGGAGDLPGRFRVAITELLDDEGQPWAVFGGLAALLAMIAALVVWRKLRRPVGRHSAKSGADATLAATVDRERERTGS